MCIQDIINTCREFTKYIFKHVSRCKRCYIDCFTSTWLEFVERFIQHETTNAILWHYYDTANIATKCRIQLMSAM